MKKKGFTLVELMAVIVILSIFALMAVPTITNTLKKQEEKAFDSYVETICMGTKTYMRHNATTYQTFFDNKASTTVCLKDVVDNGYLTDNLKNPNTEKYDSNAKIYIKYDGDKIVCDYSETGC